VSDRDVEDNIPDVGAGASNVNSLEDGAEFGYEGFTAGNAPGFLDERTQSVADVVVLEISVWPSWAGARVVPIGVEYSAAWFKLLGSVGVDRHGQWLLDAETEAGGSFECIIRYSDSLPV
jgi:hypothetical protein